MSTTIESRPLKNGWWTTDQGREVLKWFMRWGAVVKERRVTGDPSALPAGAGVPGKRGCPSDPADSQVAYLEVDMFLAKCSTPRQLRLCEFIFVDGLTEHEGLVVYVFGDGSRSDPVPFSAPPPAAYERAEHESFPVLRFDLERFPAPELDWIAREWGKPKSEMLEDCLRMLGKWFAGDRKIAEQLGRKG